MCYIVYVVNDTLTHNRREDTMTTDTFEVAKSLDTYLSCVEKIEKLNAKIEQFTFAIAEMRSTIAELNIECVAHKTFLSLNNVDVAK